MRARWWKNPVWQAFAKKQKLALLGCRITDKPHEQNFIEEYANVSQGSGDAVLAALGNFASRAHHPELGSAPLLMWGMSAGGQFNYEFVAWKPERVLAFVVNKGGIYYTTTALAPRGARDVPGMLSLEAKTSSRESKRLPDYSPSISGREHFGRSQKNPVRQHIVGRSTGPDADVF